MTRGREVLDSAEFRAEMVRAVDTWAATVKTVHRQSAGDGVFIDHRHESPIETLFELWWRLMVQGHSVLLTPQTQIQIPEGPTYRVDFAITAGIPWDRFGEIWGDPLRIAVELDGHDFHERTPDQVTTRDRRDRHLASAGWTVLHFSGSELLADPMRVVTDIETHATNHIVRFAQRFERWHERHGATLRELK